MDYLVVIPLVLLGAILGSFANVCIWRLPRGQSVAWPPSHCPNCLGKLKPWHLFPIVSWIFLLGKCGMCSSKISIRYPLVELWMAILFGFIGYNWGLTLQTLIFCLLSFALIVSIGTDLSHREIPDQVSLGSSALLGVIVLATFDWGRLIGGLILFTLLFLIAVASKGGMGGGDIKLSLAIGLALGWALGLVALMVAFLLGGMLAIVLLLGGNRGKSLPFGPFLAIGSWIAMFWGDAIIEGYWNLSYFLWG